MSPILSFPTSNPLIIPFPTSFKSGRRISVVPDSAKKRKCMRQERKKLPKWESNPRLLLRHPSPCKKEESGIRFKPLEGDGCRSRSRGVDSHSGSFFFSGLIHFRFFALSGTTLIRLPDLKIISSHSAASQLRSLDLPPFHAIIIEAYTLYSLS